MMKFAAIAVIALALQASARPQDSSIKPPVEIVSQTQTIDGSGNFNFAYESADGIKEEQTGSLKSIKVPKIDEKTGEIVGEEDGKGKGLS